MISRKALGGLVFNFHPRDLIREAYAVFDHKRWAQTRDVEILSKKHAVDEIQDRGNIKDYKNELRCFAFAQGSDGLAGHRR